MGDPGDRGHVGDEPRAVRNVAQHDERRFGTNHLGHLLGRDSARRVGLDPPQRESSLGRNTFQDIAIGGEVVSVHHDLGSIGSSRQSRPGQLVEHDGGRVRNDGLTGRSADHPGTDEVADALGPAHPSLIPATDQPGAPSLRDERLHPLGSDRQWSPERVAVEVGDDALGRQEAVPEVGQRILGVELFRAVQKPVEVRSHAPTLGPVTRSGLPVGLQGSRPR